MSDIIRSAQRKQRLVTAVVRELAAMSQGRRELSIVARIVEADEGAELDMIVTEPRGRRVAEVPTDALADAAVDLAMLLIESDPGVVEIRVDAWSTEAGWTGKARLSY